MHSLHLTLHSQLPPLPVDPAANCNAQAVKSAPAAPIMQRRDLLATGGAAVMAVLLLGPAAGPAHAAGESSATRAITAVTRPLQAKKK